MNAIFQDLQHAVNPRNGQVLRDPLEVSALLNELKAMAPPFMFQLIGANKSSLIVGIGHDFGCVQHSSNDGLPPYFLAVGPFAGSPPMEFLLGDTATPIDGRYRLSIRTLQDLIEVFIDSGERSASVLWEEFQPGS